MAEMLAARNEVVARAICKADGHDPDMMMMTGMPYVIAGSTHCALIGSLQPREAWTFYVHLATAANRALDSMETTNG